MERPGDATLKVKPDPVSPREDYLQRQARFEAERRRHAEADERIGPFRLILGALIVLTLFFTAGPMRLSILWLILLVVAFTVLVFWHSSIRRARLRAERAIAFYDSRIARIEDRWKGMGATG